MSAAAAVRLVAGEDVELAGTVYRTEFQQDTGTVWLYGPKGAVYFLRGFLGEDTGLRQVISWKSGQPLRKLGNEVRVIWLGGVMELAQRRPRA